MKRKQLLACFINNIMIMKFFIFAFHISFAFTFQNKRSAVNNELVHGPYNANDESKYVELILVVDNRKFKDLGESRQAVVSLCKNIANIVNAVSKSTVQLCTLCILIFKEENDT